MEIRRNLRMERSTDLKTLPAGKVHADDLAQAIVQRRPCSERASDLPEATQLVGTILRGGC